MPWGDAAFARARAEDKPVFLSIGYSTCHWCHVMEHESFENPEIAVVLNEYFVSIKVDREERPDVDLTYMTYVQAATGHGGWPMTVFLTPEARPFFGGTYFPPDDRHGRTGFLNLLQRIRELWESRRAELVAQAAQSLRALEDAMEKETRAGEPPEPDGLARRLVQVFSRQFDREYGGFGGAPKFPRPAAPMSLLECARLYPETRHGREAMTMAAGTLRAMAAGGIHDHLGGGFHRYAVDRIWHIPHYEKMLYDQAQLAPLFLDAWRMTGDSLFLDAADGIFRYVLRDLSHPDGGFYSAEDADSLPDDGAGAKKEGAFYVFTAEEISRALTPESAALFTAAYGVEAGGNADPQSDPHGELQGTNTLFVAAGPDALAMRFDRPVAEVEAMLSAAREVMFGHRARRPRPHRDEKIVTGWNGLMIAAFAMGGRMTGNPLWTERAELAANFYPGSFGIKPRARCTGLSVPANP